MKIPVALANTINTLLSDAETKPFLEKWILRITLVLMYYQVYLDSITALNRKTIKPWISYFFHSAPTNRDTFISVNDLREQLSLYISDTSCIEYRLQILSVVNALKALSFEMKHIDGKRYVKVNNNDFDTLTAINNLQGDEALIELLTKDNSLLDVVQLNKGLFIQKPTSEKTKMDTGFGTTVAHEFIIGKTEFVVSWLGASLVVRAKHLIKAQVN